MRLSRMDEFAIGDEVQTLHEILAIDVTVHGRKEGMFTWGGLAVRRDIRQPRQQWRAEPQEVSRGHSTVRTSRWRFWEGPNSNTVLRMDRKTVP